LTSNDMPPRDDQLQSITLYSADALKVSNALERRVNIEQTRFLADRT